MTEAKKSPQHPCIGCVYFAACGETNRTAECKGRKTKSEKKKEDGKNGTKTDEVAHHQ